MAQNFDYNLYMSQMNIWMNPQYCTGYESSNSNMINDPRFYGQPVYCLPWNRIPQVWMDAPINNGFATYGAYMPPNGNMRTVWNDLSAASSQSQTTYTEPKQVKLEAKADLNGKDSESSVVEKPGPMLSKPKDKSLTELCQRFMINFGRNTNKVIALDQWTKLLGVEKRRVYDILNIFETFNAITKKAKNQYVWKGIACVYEGLDKIQAKCQNIVLQNSTNECSQNIRNSSKKRILVDYPCETQKSLGFLWENFIAMFQLISPVITLDDAAENIKAIFENSSKLKTKVRRLYDISNVLLVLKVIKKTFLASGKPAFKWVGKVGLEQFMESLDEPENSNIESTNNIQIKPTPYMSKSGFETNTSTSESSSQAWDTNPKVWEKVNKDKSQIKEILTTLEENLDHKAVDMLEAIVKILKKRVNPT